MMMMMIIIIMIMIMIMIMSIMIIVIMINNTAWTGQKHYFDGRGLHPISLVQIESG